MNDLNLLRLGFTSVFGIPSLCIAFTGVLLEVWVVSEIQDQSIVGKHNEKARERGEPEVQKGDKAHRFLSVLEYVVKARSSKGLVSDI